METASGKETIIVLRRLIAYSEKIFRLSKDIVTLVSDRREKPRISTAAVVKSSLVLFWARMGSSNAWEQNVSSDGGAPLPPHHSWATNIGTELWNSTQGTGNAAGFAVKFTVPTVANGKIYLGTRGNDNSNGSGTVFGELDVYGLLP